MVFGGCSHSHTVKLTDKVDNSRGFLLCEPCSKDSDFENDFTEEKI